ncbi:hypothetical protein [Arthrobacter sp. Soil763]|uniref:hypothetical protein n=1 Tax=Arthrobacter sp. Soil763 TaxID=1736402 RepID=UPI001F2512FD|nr:hypothetical protein [Arthrobacter sp. Soil763]
MGLLVTMLAACGLGGPSKEQQLESALQKAGMSVAGVSSAEADAKVNTSGEFITVKLVGETAEKETLARTLQDAMPALLESIRDVDGGTFGVSIFSPDGAVSAGPRDLGYTGSSSLSSVREFFAK